MGLVTDAIASTHHVSTCILTNQMTVMSSHAAVLRRLRTHPVQGTDDLDKQASMLVLADR
jgi:hypothetical protein